MPGLLVYVSDLMGSVSVGVIDRVVAVLAPFGLSKCTCRASSYVEVVLRRVSVRTPHRKVGLAVAVKVALCWVIGC